MTLLIPNDGTTVKEGEFSNEPLPDGKYFATILSSTKDSNEIIVRPAAKQGANSRLSVLAVRFRISNGQFGQGRNVFADVPLFRKWTPTGSGKYPDGTPAFLFFQFFRALGFDVDAPQGFQVPDLKTLLGREVELVLDTEKQEGYAPRNRVRFINKADATKAPSQNSGSSAPASQAPADIWNTPATTAPAVSGEPEKDIWGNPVATAAGFAVDPADVAYAQDPATAGKTL